MKSVLVRRRLARVLLAAGVAIIASAAPALGAGLDPLHPFAPARAVRTGVAVPATHQAALARVLAAQTGLRLSQVKAQAICPPAGLGIARCGAQTLVLRSDGRRVHARVSGRTTLQRIVRSAARLRAGASALAALQAPGQRAPQPGTPAFLQQAYDLSYLSQTAGASQTVAIVDAFDDATAESDLATYRSAYGLPPCTTDNGCFKKVNQQGQSSSLPGPNSLWNEEESLDLDAVSALCPNCHILLVEASDDYYPELQSAMHEAVALGATEISASFGYQASQLIDFGSFPVPVVAGTGDSGYWGTEDGVAIDSYPAALPDVTAAGGTSLAPAADGSGGRGFSESAWSGAGSGCDLQELKPEFQTDSGCAGRSYADLSADADPYTGLNVYDNGAWLPVGGTSLATPLIAAYYALTGIDARTPAWAYQNTARLNDPQSGDNSTPANACTPDLGYICQAGAGYDGPTGAGSISGAIVQGAPGIGGPTVAGASGNSYVTSVRAGSAALVGGVYPNRADTQYWWEYGPTTSYGHTSDLVDIGAGAAPVTITSTLANLTPSTTYHYRLVAANSYGTTYGYDYTFTTPSGTPPLNTAAPTVTGATTQGATLTASAGSWSPSGVASYQWERSTAQGWQQIAGATASTYTSTNADVNAQLRVLVYVSGADGQGSAASASSGPIAAAPPVDVDAPQITGTAAEGQTLSAAAGRWVPDGIFAYQWQRCDAGGADCAAIDGATSATYALTSSDVGSELAVSVTAANSAGTLTVASAPVGPVIASAPANVAAPRVSGNPTQGQTLTAAAGTWNPSGAISYQWQRCNALGAGCQDIVGATAATYTLGYGDVSQRLRAVVTETNATGSNSATSGAFGPVIPVAAQPITWPSVDGDPWVGRTLSADPGTWNTPVTLGGYQWLRCDTSFQNCQPINGANASAYTATSADLNSTLRFTATAANSVSRASVESLPTQPVTEPPAAPINYGGPQISGTPTEGQTLATTSGTWVPNTSAISYQWQRCPANGNCVIIAGATGSTYTLQSADVGAKLRALVTASIPAGATVSPTDWVGPVAGTAPVNAAPPQVTGTATRGQVLTALPGTWSPDGTYAYQWQRCDAAGSGCADIAGATSAIYVLSGDDVGADIVVEVTATNDTGSTTASSAPVGPVADEVPHNLASPQIYGNPTEGQTLTSSSGDWVPATGYTYQWQRCGLTGATCQDIASATSPTYTLQAGDEGMTVRLAVTAANTAGSITSVSAPLGPVAGLAPVNLAPPRVSGVTQAGQTLTLAPGTWSPDGTRAYRWQRCDKQGQNCQDIAAASGLRYVLGASDVGMTVRVVETVSNSGGQRAGMSLAVGPVAAAPPAVRTTPKLTAVGSAAVGHNVTVAGGQYTGASTVTYRFWRCRPGCAATGAPSASTVHKLMATDAGAFLRAEVLLVGPGGTRTIWASGVVGPVTGSAASSAGVSVGNRFSLRSATGAVIASGLATRANARTAMIKLTRASTARGTYTAWACAVGGAAVDACTSTQTLGRATVTLSLTVVAGDRISVIALGS